ncbi:MAG: hypothetical protein M1832_006155 [Thelocarpon impressellum]|nr:MAG: hypothetical protein M1832_006155 [Thelocarpon impressellum]
MADVRSLLRNERTSRRINHPQATYSSSGTLSCRACGLQVKSESLWDSHVKSAQHIARTRLARDEAATGPVVASEGRKRKADEGEDGRSKRSKGSATVEGLPENFFDGVTREEDAAEEESDEKSEPAPIVIPPRTTRAESTKPSSTSAIPTDFFDAAAVPVPTTTAIAVDEDEYAAFERDIAAAAAPSALDALNTTSAISAPALSAAELAARATADANAQQKTTDDAELEGEREDAARRMEEEIEEMEALEEKLARLRAQREELRKRAAETPSVRDAGGDATREEDDESDGDDEADEWDGWGLRPT